jgi:hypothetical protein
MGLASIHGTRFAAGLSLVALVVITISDFLLTDFWDRNAMATSIVADILVLVVGVAVLNEFVAYRSRRRWQLVADYALSELTSACRHTYVTLAEAIGIASRAQVTRDQLRELIVAAGGAGRIVELAAIRAADQATRPDLLATVAELTAGSRTALATWAPVLVETPYAAALNRYVEFQALLAGLDLVLWEEAQGKLAGADEPRGPGWISVRIDELIRCGAALELELYPEAAEIEVRAPHGPGPRAAVAD